MLGLKHHALDRLNHGQRRMAREQFDQQTAVGWVEVLDKDEGHPTAGRQRIQQSPEGVKAAGRRADRDHGKRASHKMRLCGHAAVRPLRGRFSCTRSALRHLIVSENIPQSGRLS